MKVYVVMEYDYRSNTTKVNSVFRKEESAHEAMLSLADYDVGDGTLYFSKEEAGQVNVYYIPDEDDNVEETYSWVNSMIKSYYKVTRELI